jgi:hypothetical protein
VTVKIAFGIIEALFVAVWAGRFLGAPVPAALVLGLSLVVLAGYGWDLWRAHRG